MADSPDDLKRRRDDASPCRMDVEKASYSTVSRKVRPPRATKTFGGRMAFFFVLTTLTTVLVLTLVLAVTWEGQFQSYTRQNMQNLVEQTAESIAAKYDADGSWTPDVLSYAADVSLSSSDVGIQVLDADGTVVYDDTWHSSRRSGGMTSTGTHVPAGAVPAGADSVVTADVVASGGEVVGTVRMWAFGSDALLTKNDSAFRVSSYQAIAVAAAIAIGTTIVIGYQFSRSLAKPIQKITNTAARIRSGDLTARTGFSGDDEFGRLGETFDGMASEIEHDIKFEHRLTSDVAHELRTPLMATLATVEAMQDGVLPADDEHFEIVAAEVRRLSRLVDAMLHLSRIENDSSDLAVEDTDLVYLCRSLVSMQEQLFDEKGLRLHFDDQTPSHELFAEVNPDLIREAITNLMSNALRYTPEGGRTLVSVARERGVARISVQDTGIGIAKEDVARVFSRFWRSDASRERVSGGLGVGLALTKEIIDRHNGSISVESELGRGTTFTLRIPLVRERDGSHSREPRPAPVAMPPGRAPDGS
ncbi:HAMP domain-containing sensor histidine kinase [Olsenella sp. HMSC062G07]|uniref:sensor histidine kinase n=1 Tax=Olsenella sp. HMSC062G07 TaxID=1739330 RepID=UPI0008A33EE2|nr:HAMP domain-containing sensor histidine kinase [Olsenella sp. HMSC062G07]